MSKVIVVLFLFIIFLFLYIFLYAIILNLFLFINKDVLSKKISEFGYKLYIYEYDKSEPILSRKERLKFIEKIVMIEDSIRFRKPFTIMLKLFNSVYAIMGLIFIVALILLICIISCKYFFY